MNKKNKSVDHISNLYRKIAVLKTKLIKLSKRTTKQKSNPDIERNLSKKLKVETIEPIESWTLHGLPNVFRSKYIAIKIIWTIIFLAALGTSIYFLYNTINEYLKYEVTTVVRLINEEETDFPVITICNKNVLPDHNEEAFNYFISYLDQKNISFDDFVAYKQSNQILYNSDLETVNQWVSYAQPYQYYFKIPINEREKLISRGNLFGVNYNGESYNSDNYVWIFNPIYGNCFQINTDSILKVQPYKENVLSLTLEYFDYYKINRIKGNYYNNIRENFIYAFASGKNSNPFIEMKNGFIFTGDIIGADVKITKSVFNKQKKPYSNCDMVEDENGNYVYPDSFNRKYFNQIKSAGYEYSQSMCTSFCQIDRIGNNCTFRASSINAPNNMDNFCPNDNLDYFYENDYNFFDDLYKFYFKNDEIDEECRKMCPLECKIEQYDLLVTRTWVKSIYNPYITLTFYFDSAGYLNHEESPSISVYNLVSNIGGAIGLLLGMSLLSVFEVLEMIVLSIYLIVEHKFKNMKQKKQLIV